MLKLRVHRDHECKQYSAPIQCLGCVGRYYPFWKHKSCDDQLQIVGVKCSYRDELPNTAALVEIGRHHRNCFRRVSTQTQSQTALDHVWNSWTSIKSDKMTIEYPSQDSSSWVRTVSLPLIPHLRRLTLPLIRNMVSAFPLNHILAKPPTLENLRHRCLETSSL